MVQHKFHKYLSSDEQSISSSATAIVEEAQERALTFLKAAREIVELAKTKAQQTLYRASMPHDKRYDYTIEWITPFAPSKQKAYMLDTMSFRMGIIVKKENTHIKPDDFKCFLWTDLYHKGYNEGDSHGVEMTHQAVQTHKDDGTVCYIYGATLLFTCLGAYTFTYRVKHRLEPEFMTRWAGGGFKESGSIMIKQPIKDYTLWIQEPRSDQITSNIYVGNYQAAQEAPEHGFGVLLNTADDAPIFPLQMLRPIILRRCPLPAGANNVIPDKVVCECVNWLRAMSDRCEKILIHSRDGFGRAGSIVLAYIFAYNKNLTFEEAIKFVEKRHFIYNHRGLKDTLYRLYPRD